MDYVFYLIFMILNWGFIAHVMLLILSQTLLKILKRPNKLNGTVNRCLVRMLKYLPCVKITEELKS